MVVLEDCGPVDIFVEVRLLTFVTFATWSCNYLYNYGCQGDLERLRESDNIFLTVHDVGSSYLSWRKFTNNPDMAEIKARSEQMDF